VARRSDELSDSQGTVDIDRDRVLVLRCQAGDATAYAELYTRYYERLLRFCRRRLADSTEAEDVAQEAFVKAWRALPRFAGERRFYPWLTVIAGNLCTDVMRKRARTVAESDGDLEGRRAGIADDEITPEERVVAAADGELAQRALQRLTVRHRRVLALREGSELTYQQIAAREGVDVSAVETLLWRARQALKREFAALNGTGTAMGGFGFGLGLVAVVRRSGARVAHLTAAAARRMAAFRFGGVPVREAVVALAVTTAAVTAGAQFLHGPGHAGSPAGAAVPPTPVSSASRVAPTISHRRAPATHVVGAAASGSSGLGATRAVPPGTVAGATGSGTSPAVADPSAVPPSIGVPSVTGAGQPGVPALPPLPPSPGISGSGLSGVVGIVTSTLPSLGSSGAPGLPASPVGGAVSVPPAAPAAALGGVNQALSSTVSTVAAAVPSAVPTLTTPLTGLLG
jgi:RNA polymerase sigma-70 factor (ECF subfamily)